MAFNGSGVFNRLFSWATDRNDGRPIEADRMDAEFDGMADALSMAMLKDGQQVSEANQNMGGFKITNAGDATNATDLMNRQSADARYHPIGATTTTDNAVARYNGTAGATQDSGVIIDDSNNVTGVASVTVGNAGLLVKDTDSSHSLNIKPGSDLTADRTLSLVTGDADRTVTLTGNLSMSGAFNMTHTITADTNVTYPTTGTLATLAGSETLTNKTLTAPVISTISNTGTITLPTASGTLATLDGTETFTNKTLTTPIIAAISNNGGTITLPTATSTLATIDGAETLTNKTLTAPIVNGNGSYTVTDTSSPVTARSTDGGSSTFPGVTIDRNSSTPANNDYIGKLAFSGRNDSATTKTFAEFDTQILDTTSGSEDGRAILRAIISGSLVDIIKYGPGVQIGSPTGGDKGAGSLNVEGSIYLNGTALSVDSQAVQKNSGLSPNENLVVKYVSVSTLDIDADAVVVFDSSGNPQRLSSVNLTAAITSSGANGLDTGSEANSTWYHIFVIYNGTTTSALLSTSATAPTMPSGYTHKGYVGAVYNGSGGDFATFYQRGNFVEGAQVGLLNNGTATTYTSVSLSAAVPSTARVARIRLGVNSSSGSNDVSVTISANGSSTTATYGVGAVLRQVADTTQREAGPFEQVMETAQSIKYFAAGTNGRASIFCNGWKY